MKTIVVFLLSLVLALEVRSNRRRHYRHTGQDTLQQEFNARVHDLGNWTCDVPKPSLIYLEDPTNGIGLVTGPDIMWIPDKTLLHRCDKTTGYCQHYPRYCCKPVETKEVHIVFRKRDMIREVDTYQRLTFTNHTRCECQRATHSPADL